MEVRHSLRQEEALARQVATSGSLVAFTELARNTAKRDALYFTYAAACKPFIMLATAYVSDGRYNKTTKAGTTECKIVMNEVRH